MVQDGTWNLLQSQAGFSAVRFGLAGDTPVPADYDGERQNGFGQSGGKVFGYFVEKRGRLYRIQFGVASKSCRASRL